MWALDGSSAGLERTTKPSPCPGGFRRQSSHLQGKWITPGFKRCAGRFPKNRPPAWRGVTVGQVGPVLQDAPVAPGGGAACGWAGSAKPQAATNLPGGRLEGRHGVVVVGVLGDLA